MIRWTRAVGIAAFMTCLWPAAVAAVECGDTITGSHKLDRASDFPTSCRGLPWGLRIQGPANVDLNGVVIACRDPSLAVAGTRGIVIEGDGVRLRNGGVVNCNAGIIASGDGHRIERLQVRAKKFEVTGFPAIGIQLLGSGSSIRGSNVAIGADQFLFGPSSRAIAIEGNRNIVQDTMARIDDFLRMGAVGILVESGEGHKVVRNSASSVNASSAISVSAASIATRVQKNIAFCGQGSGAGITDRGTRSIVEGNRVSCRSQAFGIASNGSRYANNHTGDACIGFYLGKSSVDVTLARNIATATRADDFCGDIVFDDDGVDCSQFTFKNNRIGSFVDGSGEGCAP